jgi:hypothetical protein
LKCKLFSLYALESLCDIPVCCLTQIISCKYFCNQPQLALKPWIPVPLVISRAFNWYISHDITKLLPHLIMKKAFLLWLEILLLESPLVSTYYVVDTTFTHFKLSGCNASYLFCFS